MKILFISCAYPPYNGGGVAKLLTNLSADLMKKGHQVYVFGLMDDISQKKYAIENTIINGVVAKFINVPMSSSTDFFGRYRTIDYYNPDINLILKSHLSEIKPDVVHFHAIQGLGANLITETHKEGYPTILTMHDMWWFCPNLFMTDLNLNPCNQTTINIRQCEICIREIDNLPDSFLSTRDKYLKNILKNDVDIILTNSQILKESVQKNIKNDIRVNENGIVENTEIAEKSIEPNKIIFGFVGGRSDLKGHNILIDAFNRITLSNWELHIYGAKEIGVLNLLREIIRSIKNKIFWREFLRFLKIKTKEHEQINIKYFPSYSDSEKYSTLNTLDVIIVPSIVRESFSLITREGLMLKKPIICSDCGGPEEVIKNNVNGLIFKTNDAQELKLKICTLLKNPALINEFKNNIAISDITTIEKQVDELENIYRLQDRFRNN